MTTTGQLDPPAATAAGPAPMLGGQRTPTEQLLVTVFVLVPLLALIAAVPLAWGWGLGWTDLGLALVFYVLSGLGVSVGFHRYFTHGAFKATRPLRAGDNVLAKRGLTRSLRAINFCDAPSRYTTYAQGQVQSN